MKNYLDMGNGSGWFIGEESQEAKEKAVLAMTEKIIKTLKQITKIYAAYGDAEAFETFQNRVNEAMKKGNYESFFNDENYAG